MIKMERVWLCPRAFDIQVLPPPPPTLTIQFHTALGTLTHLDFDAEDPFLARLFDVMDANKDGQVQFREFLAALSHCSRGTFSERLQFSFNMFDVSGAGAISKEDMLAVCKSLSTYAAV